MGGLSPGLERNRSAYFSGHSTASRNCCLTVLQPAHVVPVDVGHFDEHLADGRRLDLSQGLHESRPCRLPAWPAVRRGSGAGAKSISRQEPAQADHGRLAAEGLQVGADEAVRDRGQTGQVDVARPAACPGCGSPESPRGRRGREWGWRSRGRTARAGAGPGPARWAGWWRRSRSRAGARLRPSIRASSWATTRFSTSPDGLLALGRDGVDLVEEDDARGRCGWPPRRSCAGGLRSRRRTCG